MTNTQSDNPTNALPEDFLWGGAVAAPQLEGGWNAGGKGPSVVDVLTAGSHGVPRRLTDTVEEGEFYPNHEAIDFYHRYRDDKKDNGVVEHSFSSLRLSLSHL